MKFMLDTNICIYLIKQKPEKVLRHFQTCSVGDIGISSITLSELEYGVAKSQHIQKNRLALDEFLLPLEIAMFDKPASEKYGAMRTALERNGTLIGSMDMLIAAHALSLGATLVTNNTKEFKRIKDLKVVDWSK
ncbi:MAG TPA: VapC toxin family PIN domain ribonuclease [Nitrospiraceae bacterium]|jgi:tRNA(fMet)-specific endonuclease VapC|nr:VapC toxin family PIN domain ribonuclease [Nitrospiraceae bacterium]